MSWLKNIRDWIAKRSRLLLLLLGVILTAIILYLLHRPAETIVIEKNNVDLIDSVKKFYTDKNDRLWAELKTKTIEQKEAEARVAEYAAALKLKPKEIQGATVIISKTDTVFRDLKTTVIRDTVYKIEEHNRYIDIVAEAGPKTGKISLQSRDSLTILQVVKDPLIGATKRTILISNSNPYNTITSGFNFTIKEKKPYISIGPMVGINYNGKPTVGIGIMFPIINLKK